MLRVKIDKPADCFIVEKFSGRTILAGSALLCGCCGRQMAVVINDIEFPFKSNELMPNLSDVDFVATRFGVRHTCGHTMFAFSDSWIFVPITLYKKQLHYD